MDFFLQKYIIIITPYNMINQVQFIGKKHGYLLQDQKTKAKYALYKLNSMSC